MIDPAEVSEERNHITRDSKTNWSIFVIILVAFFLARGVVILCILPPLEGWDEYQHVAYIQYLIDHQTTPIARAPETSVSASLMEAVTTLPQPEYMLEQTRGAGGYGYDAYWEDSRISSLPDDSWSPPPLYQAQHSPPYYQLVEPIYSWSGGSSNLKASIAVLRSLNLLFAAGALAFILVSLGRLLSPGDARIVGLLVSLQPLFLLNSVRVANDSLAILLASFVVATGLHPRAQRSILISIVLGLAAGAATVVKAFGVVLIPFIGISYLVSALTGDLKVRRAVLSGGLSIASALLLVVPFFVGNFETYGTPTPMQEGLINRENGRGIADLLNTALTINWPRRIGWMWLYGSTWVGGWSFILLGSTLRLTISMILIIMSAGWGWRWVSSKARRIKTFDVSGTPLRLMALVALVSAALGYHMIHSKAAWGFISTNPWYAAFAFPWALTLAYAGSLQWPARRLGPSLALLLMALYWGAEVSGTFFRMLPFYSKAVGSTALERMASLRPEILDTSTLYVASFLSLFLLGASIWWALKSLPSGGSASASL